MKDKGEKVLTVYIQKEKADLFKAKCAVDGRSMTAMIREWIFKYLKKQSA